MALLDLEVIRYLVFEALDMAWITIFLLWQMMAGPKIFGVLFLVFNVVR